MISLKEKKVLLVEDAESILLAIQDYLAGYFTVTPVGSAEDARDSIESLLKSKEEYDLLIADIHLPEQWGLKLVTWVNTVSPQIKIILITSYDINNYIEFFQKEDIMQVVSKHSHFSLHELYVTAYKTLTGDIFGADKYFEDLKIYYPTEMKNSIDPENRELYSIRIRSSEERIHWTDRISAALKKVKNTPESLTKLVLDEITTNAMVRAPLHEDGGYKYQRKVPNSDVLIPFDNIILDPEDYFVIQYGYYDDWVIIASQDPHGNLNRKEILYRLKRHITTNIDTGLPDGLADTHGRGIFLLREHMTHVIFNIHRGRKTEVLCFYNTVHDIPYKNISIYEIS